MTLVIVSRLTGIIIFHMAYTACKWRLLSTNWDDDRSTEFASNVINAATRGVQSVGPMAAECDVRFMATGGFSVFGVPWCSYGPFWRDFSNPFFVEGMSTQRPGIPKINMLTVFFSSKDQRVS